MTTTNERKFIALIFIGSAALIVASYFYRVQVTDAHYETRQTLSQRSSIVSNTSSTK